MTSRAEGEGGAPQPVRFGVRLRLREPACQHAVVGRAVATPAATFVERRDRSEQAWNRGARPAAKQFGLRLQPAVADKPALEAVPALAPEIQPFGVKLRLRRSAVRRRIARFAFRDN